jgi:hypothetical protein
MLSLLVSVSINYLDAWRGIQGIHWRKREIWWGSILGLYYMAAAFMSTAACVVMVIICKELKE